MSSYRIWFFLQRIGWNFPDDHLLSRCLTKQNLTVCPTKLNHKICGLSLSIFLFSYQRSATAQMRWSAPGGLEVGRVRRRVGNLNFRFFCLSVLLGGGGLNFVRNQILDCVTHHVYVCECLSKNGCILVAVRWLFEKRERVRRGSSKRELEERCV